MPPRPQSIVILTGAGISAESGIKTFRDQNGLWENHRIEDVACPDAFARNPKLVHYFYNMRRKQLLSAEVQPNAGHRALAELEKEFRGYLLLVTQNVDDLHERAGSTKLLHMHGELLKSRCSLSDEVFSCQEDLDVESVCSCCSAKGTLRPHIVWFGEMPFEMNRIEYALSRCDLFVAIGTSGHVYPAAGFVEAVGAHTRTIEINTQTSEVSSRFQETMVGKASEKVPELVAQILR